MVSREDLLRYDFKNESPNYDVANEIEPIRKFILYKMSYRGTKFDCDRCLLAKEMYRFIYGGKYGGIINNLEPDTMNSFYTTYRQMLLNKDKVYWSMDFEKYCESKGYVYEQLKKRYETMKMLRYTWLLTDKVYNYYRDINENKEIRRFASLTHSIGNFTFVPKGFNTKRAVKFKDFWDLSLNEIKTNYKSKYIKDYGGLQFSDMISIFKLGMYLNRAGDVDRFSDSYFSKVKSNEDMVNMIGKINKKILIRAKSMLGLSV